MFDVSASTLRFWPSSASAKKPRSGSQKSSLKRRLRSAASLSSCFAHGAAPHTCARQARGADLGVVDVALQLAGRARRRRQRAVRERDRVPGVLPALVLEAGLLVAPLVLDVAVAVAVAVFVDPGDGRARVPLQLARQPACRRSSARTPRAGSGTASSRPRCRSRASAAAPRTRSSRRAAARAGSCPAPRRGTDRRRCPGTAPASRSVGAASSGANGSAWKLVIRLSRPKTAMNQGSPAAGSAPGTMPVRKRSAARSTRLRR